jgi:uncharacterized protein (TIGR02996 family)
VDALVEAMLAAPDDDAPRRVWADRLLDAGDPRGELVHVQCDLAAGGLSREAAVARRRRERELIDAHGVRWAGAFADFADRWIFRRGLIEEVHLAASAFVANADELFAVAPLARRIDLGRVVASVAEVDATLIEALASPHLERVEALALGLEIATPLRRSGGQVVRFPVDRSLVPILEGANLPRLRVLSTHGAMRAEGLAQLGPVLQRLEHVRVRDVAGHVRELFDRLAPRQLTSLCIDGEALGGALATVLAHPALARLADLRISGVRRLRDEWIDAMQLPSLASLRRLMIHDATTSDVIVAIGKAPALANLVELDVSGTLRNGMPPLEDAPRLDSLRVLRIRDCYDMHHADKGLDWPLARRLEVVDMRCSGPATDAFLARAATWDGIALYSPTVVQRSVDTDLRGWTEDAACSALSSDDPAE